MLVVLGKVLRVSRDEDMRVPQGEDMLATGLLACNKDMCASSTWFVPTMRGTDMLVPRGEDMRALGHQLFYSDAAFDLDSDFVIKLDLDP